MHLHLIYYAESDKGINVPVIQYLAEEVKVATSDLSIPNLLGTGAFGQVYFGKLRHTSVAISV